MNKIEIDNNLINLFVELISFVYGIVKEETKTIKKIKERKQFITLFNNEEKIEIITEDIDKDNVMLVILIFSQKNIKEYYFVSKDLWLGELKHYKLIKGIK